MDTTKQVKDVFKRFVLFTVRALCVFIGLFVLLAVGLFLGQRETLKGSGNTLFILSSSNNSGLAGSTQSVPGGEGSREANTQDEDDELVVYSNFARQNGLKVIVLDTSDDANLTVAEDTVSVGQDNLSVREVQPLKSVDEVKSIKSK